uniref:Uncharacterized protein n=1 Tax=Sphaerodactylus townsendi TaxID=933632 RepID=A0ACB8GCN2_9SAUR
MAVHFYVSISMGVKLLTKQIFISFAQIKSLGPSAYSHPEAVFLATVIHLDLNLLTVMKLDSAIANQVLLERSVTAVLMDFMDSMKEDAPNWNSSVILASQLGMWSRCGTTSCLNSQFRKLILVLGPYFTFSCGGNINFEAKTLDKSCGRSARSGVVLSRRSSPGYGIQFSMDLDMKIKAVLLGTYFYIDFMLFGNTGEVGQWSLVTS